MSAPIESPAIDIPPPLTCGACGALVDERQAWQRWPQDVPGARGTYLVLLALPDGQAYHEFADWRPAEAGWRIDSGLGGDAWPLAWRHLPPLPEWLA